MGGSPQNNDSARALQRSGGGNVARQDWRLPGKQQMSATPKTQMEFAPEYDKQVRYMQRTREWYLTLDTTLGGIRHSRGMVE